MTSRDLRDPEILGKDLLAFHRMSPDQKLSEVADNMKISLESLPNYDGSRSLQKDAQEVYRQEILGRAEAGDKYAKRVLEEWDERS